MANQTFSEADEAEVRALFLRQAQAETAHDIDTIAGGAGAPS
ncbi:MAG TPA: hypothetical protein VHM25_09505 [Polyangiaceae bacterium]|nr:hypothetical protein [Polyangiaceae bacterium]